MRQFLIERRAATAAETAAFGEKLATVLSVRRDAPVVLHLKGDLGAGKTTLAQGFARGVGVADPVRSPTYALMEPYETAGITMLHLDLYRLRDPSELDALGLRDWARPGVVWLVEWPEKGGDRLPAPDVRITLTVEPSAHRIAAAAASVFGETWLRKHDMS